MTDASRNFSQLDILLPSQQLRSTTKHMPERRLMVAVFHEALECLVKYRAAADPKGRRAFAEARQWFLAEEAEWPYSFESICAVLDLDSGAVLARLLRDGSDTPPRQTELQGAGISEESWLRSAAAAHR